MHRLTVLVHWSLMTSVALNHYLVSFWVCCFKYVNEEHAACFMQLCSLNQSKHFLSWVGKRQEVKQPFFSGHVTWFVPSVDIDNVMNFTSPELSCLLTMRLSCCWTPSIQSCISWNYCWSSFYSPCMWNTLHLCQEFEPAFFASRVPLFFSSGWPRYSCLARAVAGSRN